MKNFFPLLLLLVTCSFCTGCGGEDDTGTNGFLDPNESKLEITLNDTPYTLIGGARELSPNGTPSMLISIGSPTGTEPFVLMTISITNYIGVGEYPIGGDANAPDILTRRAANITLSGTVGTDMVSNGVTVKMEEDGPIGTGTLKITEDGKIIRGTLNFTAFAGHRDGNFDFILDHTIRGANGEFQLNNF